MSVEDHFSHSKYGKHFQQVLLLSTAEIVAKN